MAGHQARSAVFAYNVPAIHVFVCSRLGLQQSKTWMPGTRPGMTDE